MNSVAEISAAREPAAGVDRSLILCDDVSGVKRYARSEAITEIHRLFSSRGSFYIEADVFANNDDALVYVSETVPVRTVVEMVTPEAVGAFVDWWESAAGGVGRRRDFSFLPTVHRADLFGGEPLHDRCKIVRCVLANDELFVLLSTNLDDVKGTEIQDIVRVAERVGFVLLAVLLRDGEVSQAELDRAEVPLLGVRSEAKEAFDPESEVFDATVDFVERQDGLVPDVDAMIVLGCEDDCLTRW